MSIRNRILAVAGSFALMALMVMALGLVTIRDYNATLKHFDRAWMSAWRGERLNHLVSKAVMESRGLYLPGQDVAERTTFAGNLNRDLDDINTLMAEWTADVSPGEAARLAPLRDGMARFVTVRREVARLGAAGQAAEAEALGVANRPERVAFQAKLDGLVAATQGELAEARARTETYSRQRAVWFALAALVGIVAMLGLTVWLVARFITRPLRELAAAIVRTSQGQYDTPLAGVSGGDEVASVWQALAVLKTRAIEHDRMAEAQREAERQAELKLREILLD